MTDSTHLLDWKSITANLSREQQNYNELRGHYARHAKDAAILFSTEYENQFKSLENIVQNVSTLATPYIQGAIDDAIGKLADHNIFDIDRDYFITTYHKKYDTWSHAHERIAEKYAEIMCSTAEMDAYRTARRQSSGQVIGGGFGLDGAVKGMAVATAANLAIDAAHGLFNLVAKGLNSVGDSGKKNRIFLDPQTKADLMAGLEKSVLNVHLSLLDALDASTINGRIFQRVSISDQDKAQRMLMNLQRGSLSNADPGNVLTQVLTLDPYCLDAYIYALNKCGDTDGNIEKMANFFHLDLIEEKRRLVRALYRDTAEVDVINSIREIDQIGARLGIPVESEFVEPLKVTLHKFDLEARTFKDHLYPTRDAAKAEEVRTREEQEKKIKDALDSVKKGTSQVLNGATRIIKFGLYCIIIPFVGIISLAIVISAYRAVRDWIVPPQPQQIVRSLLTQPKLTGTDQIRVEFSGRSTIEVRDAKKTVLFTGEYSEPHSALITGKLPFEISVGTVSNVQISRILPGQDQGFPIDLMADANGQVVDQLVE